MLEFAGANGNALYAGMKEGKFCMHFFPGDAWGFRTKDEADRALAELRSLNPGNEGLMELKPVALDGAMVVEH